MNNILSFYLEFIVSIGLLPDKAKNKVDLLIFRGLT